LSKLNTILKLNVKNETSRLRAVFGTALSNGETPSIEAYDPKSLEHILAGPVEKDMVVEMDAFTKYFKNITSLFLT
jgi:hypothetical protein